MSHKIIVALDANGLIGNQHTLPWHIPEDLAYFRRITMGHAVIMGKNSFQAIGKVLPGRTNVVLSSDPLFSFPGITVFSTVEAALKAYSDAFIIGGASVFRQTIGLVSELYITHIEAEFIGDAYFPSIDPDIWHLHSQTELQAAYPLRFCVYRNAGYSRFVVAK